MKHSWKRPKLKIPKTTSEWVWDIIGYTFYIGSIVLLIIVWSKLPEKVPAHYNAAGEVDRWGSKWELVILPVVGAFNILLMQTFELFPELHNYPRRFNESNAEQFYLNSRRMLNQMKNACFIIFALILFESISISLTWHSGFGKWFLPIVISIVFIPLIVGIVRQRKIK